MFTKGLILAIFDPAKKIIVEIDVSKIALSSILSQLDEEKRLYPIIFYSRKFTAPELNYDIYDKELLAIVDNFKMWRVYLEGLKHIIKIYTDYKNLKSFTSTKILNQK